MVVGEVVVVFVVGVVVAAPSVSLLEGGDGTTLNGGGVTPSVEAGDVQRRIWLMLGESSSFLDPSRWAGVVRPISFLFIYI